MKYTKGEREYHVRQQELSRKSAAAYCKEQSINYHTFVNWRRKYKNREEFSEGTGYSHSFVEITLPGSGLEMTGKVNIYLSNGVRIQLDQELNSELLKLLNNV